MSFKGLCALGFFFQHQYLCQSHKLSPDKLLMATSKSFTLSSYTSDVRQGQNATLIFIIVEKIGFLKPDSLYTICLLGKATCSPWFLLPSTLTFNGWVKVDAMKMCD